MICENVVNDNVANLGYSFIEQFDKTAHLLSQFEPISRQACLKRTARCMKVIKKAVMQQIILFCV